MSKKWYLGSLKGTNEAIYLSDFKWECGWYWEGGYIGNSRLHCHFDDCFLIGRQNGHPFGELPEMQNGCAIWEDLDFFLDRAQYNANEWWRIKDLFKQFYAYREAAEAFRYGGHCSGKERHGSEIVPAMEGALNAHIRDVIIPLTRKALDDSCSRFRANLDQRP